MKRFLKIIPLLAALTYCTNVLAVNLTVQFTKITDTLKSNPNGFQHLHLSVYWDGLYAFIGSGHGATNLGIFSNIDNSFKDIVTDDRNIPNGSGQFTTFASADNALNGTQLISINENNLAFLGTGDPDQSGVYQYRDHKLRMIANEKTPLPKGDGEFKHFAYPQALADESVGFWGEGAENQQGVYLANKAGLLQAMVSTATPIPSGQGKFTHISNVSFAQASNAHNTGFVFIGKGRDKQLGLYRFQQGQLKTVVNQNSQLPNNGTGFFTHITAASFDSTMQGVAFIGGGVLNQEGIYYNNGQQTITIADDNSFIPNGVGTFDRFSEVSTNGKLVAFHGSGTSYHQHGIYIYSGDDGSIYKLVTNNDKIDGKTVDNAYISGESLYQNHIALLINFKNGTQAIYIATFELSAN